MSNVHWGPHAVFLCDRMEQKRSHARHPGGRCSGRKTWGVWPPTLPRRCPQTSVPQQFPHPLSPWGRFRVMVSIVKPTAVVSPIYISSPGGRLGAEEDSHSSRYDSDHSDVCALNSSDYIRESGWQSDDSVPHNWHGPTAGLIGTLPANPRCAGMQLLPGTPPTTAGSSLFAHVQ